MTAKARSTARSEPPIRTHLSPGLYGGFSSIRRASSSHPPTGTSQSSLRPRIQTEAPEVKASRIPFPLGRSSIAAPVQVDPFDGKGDPPQHLVVGLLEAALPRGLTRCGGGGGGGRGRGGGIGQLCQAGVHLGRVQGPYRAALLEPHQVARPRLCPVAASAGVGLVERQDRARGAPGTPPQGPRGEVAVHGANPHPGSGGGGGGAAVPGAPVEEADEEVAWPAARWAIVGDRAGGGGGGSGGDPACGGGGSSRLDWTGLDWTGLDWTGLDWTGLDWTGLDWTGLDWTGLEWTGLDWTGLEWTGLEWTGLEWTGLE